MCLNEKRTLTIPASMAYGTSWIHLKILYESLIGTP